MCDALAKHVARVVVADGGHATDRLRHLSVRAYDRVPATGTAWDGDTLELLRPTM